MEPRLEEMAFVFLIYKCKLGRMLGMLVRGIFTFGSEGISMEENRTLVRRTELTKC